MNPLRGVPIIWYRDLLRFWRDKARLVASFVQPLFILLVVGTGISRSTRLVGDLEGLDYMAFMFPGVVVMIVLITSVMCGASIVWDRELGFLKEVLVAPVSSIAVVIGKTLGGASIAVIPGTAMLLLAPVAGVSLAPARILPAVGLIFFFAVSLNALGIFAGSRIKTLAGFQVVMQLTVMGLLFLSPALFPGRNLPWWLSWLVRVNPVSYGVDALRQMVLSTPDAPYTSDLALFGHPMTIAGDVAMMALFGLVMIVLAMRSLRTEA